jgi:hypothetical protein
LSHWVIEKRLSFTVSSINKWPDHSIAQFSYFSTLTPFQKATYPLIWLAAGLGSG